MNDTLRQFRDFFVSMKLTVVLLGLSIILIFAATLDQVHLGIWAVQEKYFRTFVVLWKAGEIPVPIFPGGYFIGGLLLVNLLSAHFYRFKLTWRKFGIHLTHGGLILLLVGELLSGLWQEEYQMRLEEGETKNFSESYRFNELAITDVTDPAFDDVTVIPESKLQAGKTFQIAKLPFQVVCRGYFPNAAMQMRSQAPDAPPSLATKGMGPQVVMTPLPLTYKPDERNLPAAYIELIGSSGSLGTWLVSPQIALPTAPQNVLPQHFEYGGRKWKILLRLERSYKPFSVTLLKFTHDIYAGTDIPKNFSSKVHLTTPGGRDDRDVLIYMNNPLRYAGLTFFQAGFEGDHTTVLQVVRNPSWILPYVACVLMTLGLVFQFGLHLFGFINKRRSTVPAAA
jgi:hypothetical protein